MSRRSLPGVLLAPALLVGLLASCGGEERRPDDRPSEGASDRAAFDGPVQYVALGDSYAAAPGVPTSVAANACFRSTNNIGAQVFRGLPQGSTFVDSTCSGASTRHLTTAMRAGVPPQVAPIGPDTDLVTIRLGANNGKLFGQVVFQCTPLHTQDPTGSPCKDGVEAAGIDLEQQVDQIEEELVEGLRLIRQKAPRARVIVVGYPTIFPAEGDCPDRVPLATGDVAYAAEMLDAVTDAQQAAAERAGVEFVDTREATLGHDICAEDAWIQDSTTDFTRASAWHPRLEEQQVAAQLVLKQLALTS